MLVRILVALVLAASLSNAQGTGCWYRWYWEAGYDTPERTMGQTNGPTLVDAANFQSILANEGSVVSIAAGTGAYSFQQFHCGTSFPYYRIQSCNYGRPLSRNEVFVETPGKVSLPGRLNQGYELLIVWLADDNPGCEQSSQFRGASKPEYRLDVVGIVGTDARVAAIANPSMHAKFTNCSGGDNCLNIKHVVAAQGTQYNYNLGLSLFGSPSLGVSTTVTPNSLPWEKNALHSSPYADSGWVSTTYDCMLLRGMVQSQIEATGRATIATTVAEGATSAPIWTLLHTNVFDSRFLAGLEWTATPIGTPSGSASTSSGGTTPPPSVRRRLATPNTPGGITTSPWPGPWPSHTHYPPSTMVPDVGPGVFLNGGTLQGSAELHPNPGCIPDELHITEEVSYRPTPLQ